MCSVHSSLGQAEKGVTRKTRRSAEMSGKPACKYGADCTRKNPQHFADFSHPLKKGGGGPAAPPPKKIAAAAAVTKKPAPACAYLVGKTICFTGAVTGMIRTECRAKAEALGARVVDDISKKVDILFIGDSPGSKRGRAEDLGIEVRPDSDFVAMVNGDFDEKLGGGGGGGGSGGASAKPVIVEKKRFVADDYEGPPAKRHEESWQGKAIEDAPKAVPKPADPPPGKPMCPFGKRCYRKNPAHFEEFAHPDVDEELAAAAAPAPAVSPRSPPAAAGIEEERRPPPVSAQDTVIMDPTRLGDSGSGIAVALPPPMPGKDADAGMPDEDGLPPPLHRMDPGDTIDFKGGTG